MHKRLLTILATITLSTALLIGCGNKQEEIPQTTTEKATETTTEESTTEQTIEATATPEETIAPTPETTEEPSEEVAIETETETVAPEPTEGPTPETEPQATYTYTDMTATMYAQQTVNVRDLPDTNGNKLGSLSTNDEISISAKCNETGWYMFEYNGNKAFVSNKYVGENKVEVQQAPADNGSTQVSSGKKNWSDDYVAYTWYDMNDFMFIIVNTREEAINTLDYSSARATLEARFPGNEINSGAASPLRDGHYMCFAYKVGIFVDSFVAPYK